MGISFDILFSNCVFGYHAMVVIFLLCGCFYIDERRSKTLETVFSIAICRQSGDKWQSKSVFLTIFDLHSSIVSMFSIAAYPVCI